MWSSPSRPDGGPFDENAEQLPVCPPMLSHQIFWNGVDGRHGGYLFAPSTAQDLVGLLPHSSFSQSAANQHRQTEDWRQQLGSGSCGASPWPPLTSPRISFGGTIYGTDTQDLAEAGWGVIFPANGNRAVMEALVPLLRMRRDQATSRSEMRFRLLAESDGYRPGETGLEFLERHGVGPGPSDPDQLPYYLLLVGSAREIPYEFQYQLASQYAIGRLAFESVEGYVHYAAGLVRIETGKRQAPRRASFFGVQHHNDPATQASATELIAPLADRLRSRYPKYGFQTVLGGEADKKQLTRIVGGDQTPALLFVASHGVGYPCGDRFQRELQGAILCGDSPGPAVWSANKRIPVEHLFSAQDVGSGARFGGLIVFLNCCFGGGTPQYDTFAKRTGGPPRMLSPEPFEALLPQRLLGHPNGGAAAVIAHVDRTWMSSFRWKRAGAQFQAFESVLRALLEGRRVGSAMDAFTLRRGELAAALNSELEFDPIDPLQLAGLWTAHNDARSFVILGDPAARLNVA